MITFLIGLCIGYAISFLVIFIGSSHESYDYISRQAVLSYIVNDLKFGDEENGYDLERKIAQEEIYNFIEKMPSITPKEKAGILDNIKTEIEKKLNEEVKKKYDKESLMYHSFGLSDGLKDAIDIIDKYREVSK